MAEPRYSASFKQAKRGSKAIPLGEVFQTCRGRQRSGRRGSAPITTSGVRDAASTNNDVAFRQAERSDTAERQCRVPAPGGDLAGNEGQRRAPSSMTAPLKTRLARLTTAALAPSCNGTGCVGAVTQEPKSQ